MFEKARIIESDNNEEYVVMSVIKESDKEYAFANKLNSKKEPMNEYIIFTIINNEITIVDNNSLINRLLPIFQKEIDKDLKEILNVK